jgi:hypothetical protein
VDEYLREYMATQPSWWRTADEIEAMQKALAQKARPKPHQWHVHQLYQEWIDDFVAAHASASGPVEYPPHDKSLVDMLCMLD